MLEQTRLLIPPKAALAAGTRLLALAAAADARWLDGLLTGSGQALDVLAAESADEALEQLLTASIDVVVVCAGDSGDPFETLRRLRTVAIAVPVVLLFDRADGDRDLRAIREGAQDVLTRTDLDGPRLVRALSFAVERERADAELARRALHDPLTGLPNRALLRDRLAHAITRLSRSGQMVGVLVLDLDGFKAVNDRLGHDAGDQVLNDVAQRITSAMRGGDTAARFGGDEFVMLCEGLTSESEVLAVAERVGAALAEPFRVDVHEAEIRASIGIAIARGAGVSPDALLQDADSAMYSCKQRQAPFELFDDDMRRRATHRMGLEADLRRALEAGDFTLHYQPIFMLNSGSIVGCEALLRWIHPERGIVAPGEFLDVAEEFGLMVPIGAWALGSALRQASLWGIDRSGEPVPVSLNLSPRQLVHDGAVELVSRALEHAGVPPGTLCLEFSEGAVTRDPIRAGRALRGFKELGVQLAIDDFGTGSSSLRLLEQLPVDTVKIDRSFTAGMSDSREEAAIIAAVVGLAHAFGLTVIAEGVERLEQVDRLRALGCDAAQGFYFAAPQPGAELGGLLDSLA